jgi:hypothetical protein
MVSGKDKLKALRFVCIILLIIFIFLAYVFIDRGRLTKVDYKSIEGRVITTGYDCLLGAKNTKIYCYYFKLHDYDQTLAITTDNDYKPVYDKKFKGLYVGDTITVKLLSDLVRDNVSINLNVGMIERNNQILYNNIHDSIWNRQMKIGICSLLIGLVLIGFIIVFSMKIKNAR